MDATTLGQMIDPPPYKAPDERRAEGKALREPTLRAAQRAWRPRLGSIKAMIETG